jgi:hypothetical protein
MIDFFQTLNVKRFIFADGDNVNNPKVFIDFLNEQKYLELDTQIICFIGANTNQNTWYNNAVKYIQTLNKKSSFNLTPIRIITEGSNALDMVLSSYVGLAMGQNPRAEFIIVSNDKGYDSVINHFGSLGLKISRKSIIHVKATNAGNKNQKQNELIKDDTNEIIDSLLKTKIIKRPQKINTLKNYLKNSLGQKNISEKDETLFNEILKELKNRKILTQQNQSLNWKK